MKAANLLAVGAALLCGSTMVDALISDAESALMLQLLNLLREQRGVPPLALEQRMNSLAEEHSLDMAKNCQMVHEGSDGTSPGQRVDREGIEWRLAGENIAAGQGDVRTVMNDWIESPPHLENLLNPRYNFVGFGKSINTACSNFDVYWTQDFAQIASGAIPDPVAVDAPSPIGRPKSATSTTPARTTTTTTTTKATTTTTTTTRTTTTSRRTTTTTAATRNNFRGIREASKKTTTTHKSKTKTTRTPTPTAESVESGSTDPTFVPAPRYKCVPRDPNINTDAYTGGQENVYTGDESVGTDAQQLTAGAFQRAELSFAIMLLCILLPVVFI